MEHEIKPLSCGVVKKLRSGINITSVAHCVEELVLNSIDAEANCIAVHLNLPLYQIQVIDNGHGMDLEQMKLVGKRYATSKCHTLKDLQNLKSGGFRGEALSSMKEVSSVLMIESRVVSETFCKIFTQGNALPPKKSINSRPSKGTTVSVYDFMYNIPVRRNSISPALDLEECRRAIQGIALMHPDVSFTLKNEVTGEMCLQLKKCKSLIYAFLQMFGKNKSYNLKSIDYQVDEYHVSGCVSTNCHVSKDLQFLYVNKRRVLNTKLHKLINDILNKALNSRQKFKYDIKLTPNSSSPTKTQVQYCVFALNLSNPYDKFDIIFEPRKTMVEFSEWDKIFKLVEEALVTFLKAENLYVDSCEAESTLPRCTLGENINFSSFDILDCQQGLFSHVARRLPLETAVATENNQKVAESSSSESNSAHNEKFLTSRNKVSNFVCLRTDKPSVSLLDSLKLSSTRNLTSKSKDLQMAVSSSNSQLPEAEFDIPCRSVFPSISPVMLRVPITSTLSDLCFQAGSNNSDFLRKLKEKFQFSPEKKTVFPLKNEADFKQQNDKKQFVLNHESKEEYYNVSNMRNKSSQCSSVSTSTDKRVIGQHKTMSQSEVHGKISKDKSFQYPSVSLENRSNTISRFQFGTESVMLPLKRLHESSRLERETKKNRFEECISTMEDLIKDTSCDTEFSKVIKARSHIVNEKSILNKEKNILIDNSNVSNKSSTTGSITDNECYVYNFDKPTKDAHLNPRTKLLGKYKCKNSTSVTLEHLDNLSFELQPFDHVNNVEASIDVPTVSTYIDKGCTLLQDELNDNSDNNNFFSECLDACEKYTSGRTLEESTNSSSENFKDLSSKVDSQLDNTLIVEKMHVVTENIQNKSNIDINYIPRHHLDKCSSELLCIENDVSHKNFGLITDRKLNSPSKILSKHSAIQNIESELSQVIEFPFKPLNSQNESIKIQSLPTPDKGINVLHSNKNYLSPSISELNVSCDVEFETFSNCLPSLDKKDLLQQYSEKIEHACLKQDTLPEIDNTISKDNSLSIQSGLFKTPPFSKLLSANDEAATKVRQPYNSVENVAICDKWLNSLENQGGHKKSLEKLYYSENTNNDNNMLNSKSIIQQCSSIEKNILETSTTNNGGTECAVHQSRWKASLESKTEMVIYIDTITGNSTYALPEDGGYSKVNLNTKAEQGASNKSHFFLTHDYSPFISKSQTPRIKEVSIEFQKNFKDFFQKSEKCDKIRKWRLPEDQSYGDMDIECMLSKWENPMFDVPFEVSCIEESKTAQILPQMYSFLNSYKFSQSSLKSLQVIGQVDCKFIACILKDFNKISTGQKLLALFDQHAVHERIRLEELTEDLYQTNSEGEKLVKSSALYYPLEVSFDSEEIRLLRSYHNELQKLGINLGIENESLVCTVHSVPSCLVYKDTNDLRRNRADTIVIIQDIITEWLRCIVKTRSIPQVLPKPLASVLNSQACRGAVKFGDPLSLEQCCDLLESLSKCKLPFQCAHGRPSMAPILDLNKVKALYKKRPFSNHQKLFNLQEET